MKFPKPVMKTTELVEMGFPKRNLLAIANTRNQNVAFRLKKNGCIFWDTEKLKKYLEQHSVR